MKFATEATTNVGRGDDAASCAEGVGIGIGGRCRRHRLDFLTGRSPRPGITLNTTPTDYNAIKQMQLARFDGTKWVPLGGLIGE